MLPFVRLGILLGVSAALSPGPFQSLVIAESLVHGWRKTVPITFAPLIVDIPVAGLLVFALTQVPESFLVLVHFAGALLLFVLAWRLWREIQGSPMEVSGGRKKSRGGLRWGVFMLFLSPGPYLFWSLINGPILLRALDISIWHAAAFLAAFYLVSIGGLIALAYLLSRLGEQSDKVHRGLQYASLALMLGIALFLIQQGMTSQGLV